MAKHFFFTDQDILNIQLVGQEFGSVATNPTSQYQVTSKHTAAGIPNAYAVSDGVLFVQNAGINLVNLILKPTSQPPFQFPKIKFYIYRGIVKSSLVNGLEVATSSSNDLTKSIWDSQVARNASAGTSDSAPKEALGIDISGSGSLDEVFYRENISYQLSVVQAGWSLGKFDAAGFGFEIMVESIGFDPDLVIVRNAINIVSVSAIPTSPSQAQEFEYWHDKEAVLNYIDPCAFFGCFYHSKLKVKSSNGSISTKKENEIYDDILSKYINKNVTYLDIRNEYNFSINYFKNYGTYTNTEINLAFDNVSALSLKNYYNSGWPILKLSNAEFLANNVTKKNSFRIALPDGAGDNPLPTLYISSGYLAELYPKEPKDKNKLIDLIVISGFTNEVLFTIPNRNALAGTTVISSYIKLKYCKRFDPNAVTHPVSSGTVIRASHYLDNIFQPFAMKIPFAGNDKIKSLVYYTEFFIDSSLINFNQLVMSIGIAIDIHNISLFAYPQITLPITGYSDLKDIPLSFSGFKDNSIDDFIDFFASKNDALAKELQSVVNGSNIEYLELEKELNKTNSNIEDPGLDNFYQLSIDKLGSPESEWQKIQNLIQTNLQVKYPIFIGLINKTIIVDDNGYDMQSFDIVIRGFESINNSIQFKEVNTNLKTYSNATE